MGFEPMRISPVELKSTDLTKLAYPRYTNISQTDSLDRRLFFKSRSSTELTTCRHDLIDIVHAAAFHTRLRIYTGAF